MSFSTPDDEYKKEVTSDWYSEMSERINRLQNPLNHPWLIARMQKLGYAEKSEGLCFGVAAMGMQAILTNNLNTFKERLEKMREIPLEDFAERIHEARKRKPTRYKDKEKQDMIEILAFCDGIELCRSPVDFYSH